MIASLREPLSSTRVWLGNQLADSPDRPQQSNSSSREFGRFRPRKLAIICAIIFFAASTIRLLYWQDTSAEIARGNSTIQALAHPYRDEARRMLDTGRILFPQAPVDLGDARVIVHPPGYSIMMAAAAALFGDPDEPLRLTQILFATAQAVMVFLIAIELLPVSLATIAGLLAAFSPHLAYYSIFLSPDSLAVLPILVAVYLIARASRQPRMMKLVGAGVFLGLSCWLRSNSLLLSIFLSAAVLFLFPRDKRLPYALALVGAALLIIAPITIRNWVVYGRIIPISIGSGLNLVEGIAEYDKEGKFGLPLLDPDVQASEVKSYGRADYARSLYVPDGIQRDRDRFAAGSAVVRSNPGWFVGVMLRRSLFMLRYNDFWIENPSFNTPIAPAVSATPTFGHALVPSDDLSPVWSHSMADAITDNTFVAPAANASVDDLGQWLEIIADSSESGDQFVSGPVAVEKGADYIFAIQVKQARGALSIKVRTADPRIILASSRIRERKQWKAPDAEDDSANSRDRTYLQFASGDATEVRLVIANARVTAAEKAEDDRSVVRLGRADLLRMGPTPYQWTRYPRSFIRGIQKNLYKTEWMWLLIVSGIGLLVLAGRARVLIILLSVPAYYLIVHSALHTEYRYILAIHYFLFICAAVTLHFIWTLIKHSFGGRFVKEVRA